MVRRLEVSIPDNVYYALEKIAKVAHTTPQHLIVMHAEMIALEIQRAAEHVQKGVPIDDHE
jgi:hypothetical protein